MTLFMYIVASLYPDPNHGEGVNYLTAMSVNNVWRYWGYSPQAQLVPQPISYKINTVACPDPNYVGGVNHLTLINAILN